MTRGVLLFAFNSPKYDYFAMAKYSAKRINHFLKLPVTLVTDQNSFLEGSNHFDKVILTEADKTNKRDWGPWFNKGRYKAYEYSPYDETILLDTDYMVCSDKLLKLFDIYDDFCCHDNTEFFMQPNAPQEILSAYSHKTLWATVIAFKKTQRAKHIFECLEMVQKNYTHYANIHSFVAGTYRNDYALTLALRMANGQSIGDRDIIPWNLLHLGKNTTIHAKSHDPLNTEYVILYDNWQRAKIKKEYIEIKDCDFHVMNKDNFMELVNE